MSKREQLKNIDNIITRLNNLCLSIKDFDYEYFKRHKLESIKELENIIEFVTNLEFLKEYFINTIRKTIVLKAEKSYEWTFEKWILRDLKELLHYLDTSTTGNISHSKAWPYAICVIKNFRVLKETISDEEE